MEKGAAKGLGWLVSPRAQPRFRPLGHRGLPPHFYSSYPEYVGCGLARYFCSNCTNSTTHDDSTMNRTSGVWVVICRRLQTRCRWRMTGARSSRRHTRASARRSVLATASSLSGPTGPTASPTAAVCTQPSPRKVVHIYVYCSFIHIFRPDCSRENSSRSANCVVYTAADTRCKMFVSNFLTI